MILAAGIMVAAVALDSATFVAMGPAAEVNPLVLALGPAAAIAARWVAVVVALVAVRPKYSRIRRPAYLAAALVAVVGAASNTLVLLG